MKKRTLSAILTLLALAAPLCAQEKPQAKEPEEAKPQPRPTREVPVRLQVVFMRYQGEKKVSSLPYTLSVNTDDRAARVRLGIQVPIRSANEGGGSSVSYRDVGNNLDCSVYSPRAADQYKVMCSFEQSSVYLTEAERVAAGSAVGSAIGSQPLFRTFRSEANLLLRDGQTALYTAATDPVSGEVLKIEVTLNLVR